MNSIVLDNNLSASQLSSKEHENTDTFFEIFTDLYKSVRVGSISFLVV